MKVFVCYASEDRDIAERIHLSLLAAKFTVFFDAQSLPAGGDYQLLIRNEIATTDIFVFLISRHSIEQGRFTLTELELVRKQWPHPATHVLAVNLYDLPPKGLPNYLKAATLLTIHGDAATEVRMAAEQLRERQSVSVGLLSKRSLQVLTTTLALAGAVGGLGLWAVNQPTRHARYEYVSGYFAKVGDEWVEQKYAEEKRFATFTEQGRDERYIYLVQPNRLIAVTRHTVYVRIPVNGGMSQYSIDSDDNWVDNFVVSVR